MSPFEIALAVRKRPDNNEPLQAFLLRTMPGEQVRDVHAAMELMIGWEQAYDDFEALLNLLKPLERKTLDAKIEVLIARKRALGYDPALEALLARKWRCPHCKQFAALDTVEVPVGDPDRLWRCTTCGEEGIAPVGTEAKLDVRDGGKSGLRPI